MTRPSARWSLPQKHAHQPPRARLPASSSTAASATAADRCTRPRPTRALCPLAVLPVEVPLLRFQQPCPRRRSTRRAGAPRCSPSSSAPRPAPRGGRSTSVFFGGGTPSLMAPETVAGDDRARRRALDAGRPTSKSRSKPTRLGRGRTASPTYRAAGVNRVSLGVQALDDAALRFLGREHSAAEAIARSGDWQRSLFARFSFDLIYAPARPDGGGLAAELAQALALAGDHLSLYQLTHRARAPPSFGAPRPAKRSSCRRGLTAALYELTASGDSTSAGLPAYEISNHARPGRRMPPQSRLLALRRLCRHRSRRARPRHGRRREDSDAAHPLPRGLAGSAWRAARTPQAERTLLGAQASASRKW